MRPWKTVQNQWFQTRSLNEEDQETAIFLPVVPSLANVEYKESRVIDKM
jgi:hypothetical protein